MSEQPVWPTELRVSKDRRQLTVAFNTGETHTLSSEMLRVMSPSAEVQGHSPDQRITVGGKKNVEIMQMKPVGNYAVRIVFDDMHDTGIFSWAYLLEMGREKDEKWAAHLAELAEKGLER
ncbi:gamma-butyrobetaine hydroxylase-like domain-containing protein [Oricola sp.]|uniref:gamma-butyrobetaine hydroxylase-like domain-containing protein n=1 Tax=Oricola sp. TaxID=1979950 RepID=UPI003BAA0C5C